MTLEEAIEREHLLSERFEKHGYRLSQEEHSQLADWLEELKERREHENHENPVQ